MLFRSLASLITSQLDSKDPVHDNLRQTRVSGCEGGRRGATSTSGPDDPKGMRCRANGRSDTRRSSASLASAQREGFERVLSLVALGEIGIVGSRELSRLSRTDKDWCWLLEVCQIFGTLIADEQQVYDLNYLDDQLVLGIKGTLSVVELKVIR